jgi:hypothetical protein
MLSVLAALGLATPTHAALVSLWHLDENTGTTVADAQGAHNGTFGGTPNPGWTTGHPGHGSGLTFASNDAHVLIANHADFTPGALSIVAWIYAADATPTTVHNILTKIHGATGVAQWAFFLRSNGTLRCSVNGGGTVYNATTTGTLADATWLYAGCTWDGATLRVYRNGTEDGTGTATTGTQTDNTYAPRLGNSGYAGGLGPFTGTIDEVAYYNHALSQGEMQALISGGATGPSTRRRIQLGRRLWRWLGLPQVLVTGRWS